MINIKFLSITSKSIGRFFRKIFTKKSQSMGYNSNLSFKDLAPSDNVDKDGGYIYALNWALDNNNVKNIAITGLYGSGKSSVISTFNKHIKNGKSKKNKKIINVSLASFKDEKKEIDEVPKSQSEMQKDNTQLLNNVNVYNQSKTTPINSVQEIEKSILQQLFYSIRSKRLPFSRFKRINNISNIKIVLSILLLLIMTFIGLCLFKSDFIRNSITYAISVKDTILNVVMSNDVKFDYLAIAITSAMYLLFFAGFLLAVFLIIKFIFSSIKISKINISKLEIVIDKEHDTSIFNKYLDEIIYFFEMQKNEIVIIEDLDRFNSVEIFTKLRELNTLINNAEQIKQSVKFIYAIRDDMFSDETERTKFFDFIIPVIPAVVASNSNVEFRNILNGSYEFSDSFINDISLYINDTRLLKNIVNEFRIYHHKLVNAQNILLDIEKLFSLIVYKNKNPQDFALLQKGEGQIQNIFNSKNMKKIELINDANNKIRSIEDRIEESQQENLNNFSELKAVFIYYLEKHCGASGTTFSGFTINTDTYTKINFLDSDFDFNSISDTTNIVFNSRISCSVKALQDEFDLPSFKDRAENIKIKSNSNVEKLKKQIEELKQDIIIVKNLPFKSWVLRIGEEVFDGLCDNEFARFLLRNGYIDEDYDVYLSYYGSDLTISDFNFVLNTKNRKIMEPQVIINSPEKVASRLNELDYSFISTLNFELLEYFLKIDSGRPPLDLLLTQLTNLKKDEYMQFFSQFIVFTKQKSRFFEKLCKRSSVLWDLIENYSLFDINKKEECLKDIILNADTNDYAELNKSGRLATFVNNSENFIKIFETGNSEEIKKAETFLKTLNIQFVSIDKFLVRHKLFDYICDNKHYKISSVNIHCILEKKLKINKSAIATKNFTAIMSSNYMPLITYIEENLDDYLLNVILCDSNNNKEDETAIIRMLNGKASLEYKKLLVRQCNNVLNNIEDVVTDIWYDLLSENKVIADWATLTAFYREIGDLDTMFIFINMGNNYKQLSKTKMEDCFSDKSKLIEFSDVILHCENIPDYKLNLIYNSLPSYSQIETEKLTDVRVKLLLKRKRIELTFENYSNIKKYHSLQLIVLVEQNAKHFFEEIANYSLDDIIIKDIINSKNINGKDKDYLVSHLNDSSYQCEIDDATVALIQYLLKQASKKLSAIFFKSLINKNGYLEWKLKIIMHQLQFIDADDLLIYIKLLPPQYNKIGISLNSATIDNNDLNLSFIKAIENKLGSDIISSVRITDKYIRINMKEI